MRSRAVCTNTRRSSLEDASPGPGLHNCTVFGDSTPATYPGAGLTRLLPVCKYCHRELGRLATRRVFSGAVRRRFHKFSAQARTFNDLKMFTVISIEISVLNYYFYFLFFIFHVVTGSKSHCRLPPSNVLVEFASRVWSPPRSCGIRNWSPQRRIRGSRTREALRAAA